MKLTDTHLVMLSQASQREDSAVIVPSHLKSAAAQNVVGKLLGEGLLQEARARGTLPVWRRNADGQAMALRITKRGLQAIAVGDDSFADASPPAPPAAGADDASIVVARRLTGQHNRQRIANGPPGSPGAKQEQVLALLRASTGTTVDAVMAVTGWQRHSVRGFFAGVVKKKLGLDLVSADAPGGRTYRIAGGGSDRSTRRTAAKRRQGRTSPARKTS